MKQPTMYIGISFTMLAVSFLLRILGFIIGDNIALGMEAVHLIVDIGITFFILITLRIISSNYTKKFSYGLFKLEDLISLLLAILVAYTGIDLFITGIFSIPKASIISGIFQAISIIPLFLAAYYKIRAGKELRSPALEADGKHTFTDFYEGAGVSAGLILTGLFHYDLFYIIAILIAFTALIITAYSIGKDSIFSLLDLPKDKKIIEEIKSIASKIQGVNGVKDIRVRWAGPVIFIEIVIEMDPMITIDDAHPITEIIENEIKEKIEGVHTVTVHVEPVKRKSFRVLVPVKESKIDTEIDEKLAKAEYFAIVDINEDIKYRFIDNPFKNKNELAGLEFKEFLLDNKITDIVCENIGEITFGLMLAYNIFCWYSMDDSLVNIIEKFRKSELKKLKEPTKILK